MTENDLELSEPLREFAKELIRAGFRVWRGAYSGRKTYLFAATPEGELGYVQEDRLRGFCYSTMHVPTYHLGTGFRYAEFASLDVETMRKCCKCYAPAWHKTGGVQKWTVYGWLKSKRDAVEELTLDRGQLLPIGEGSASQVPTG